MENEPPYIGVGDGHGFFSSEFQESFRKAVIVITCVAGEIIKTQVFQQSEKISFVYENALHNVRF